MKVLAVHIVTSLLILLFTYTAINKLIEGKIFYLFLKQVPLLKNGAGVIRFLLPLTELVIVLLLLFKRTRLSGLFWSMVLMGCFIIYLGYMMVFVPELPCSCGGVISEMGWGEHLVFNVGVMGGAFWGWREVRSLLRSTFASLRRTKSR